jgi:tetratricopeptide (TPR) repeat protein
MHERDSGLTPRRWQPLVTIIVLVVNTVQSFVVSVLTHLLTGMVSFVVIGAVALASTELIRRYQDRRTRERAREEAWSAAVDPVIPLSVAECTSVSGLLRPEYGVMPFSQLRKKDLRRLCAWALRDHAVGLGLLTGSAGVGKTRLARELAYLLADEHGWRCGLVRPARELDAVKAAAGLGKPVLLIIDNDTSHPRLAEALVALARHTGAQIRMVLVGRGASVWRQALHANGDERGRKFVRDAFDIELGPLVTDEEDQHQIFVRAVRAYARARNTTEPRTRLVPPGPHSPILVIHAAALVAVLRGERGSTGPVFAVSETTLAAELLEHESDQWAVDWAARRFPPLPPTTQRQVVVVATLLGGGAISQDRHELLRLVPSLADAPAERLEQIVTWLSDLYPSNDGVGWDVLRPDLLAETFVTNVLLADPDLATIMLTKLPAIAIPQVLTLLNPAAMRNQAAGQLVRTALVGLPRQLWATTVRLAGQLGNPTDTVLADILGNADLTVEELNTCTAELTIDDSAPGCAIALARHRVALAPTKADRAYALCVLADLHRAVGDHHEAAAQYGSAAQLWRQLSTTDRRHLTDLAATLMMQGSQLRDFGQPLQALGVNEESVALWRELAEADQSLFPGLANARMNLAADLRDLGRLNEALSLEEATVTLLSELVLDNLQLRGLYSMATANLGATLRDCGRPHDSLRAELLAVEFFDDLVRIESRYRSDLGRALTNLALALRDLGHYREARQVEERAVALWRELADADTQYERYLAKALVNLGSTLGRLGNPVEALPIKQEAAALCRKLANSNPRYRVELARALDNLGRAWLELGQTAKAIPFHREAVTLGRDIANTDPRLRASLALALGNLGASLRKDGNLGEALAIHDEQVTLCYELADGDLQYREDLVHSLRQVAATLERAGRFDDAADRLLAAHRTAAELAHADASRFNSVLAQTQTQLRVLLQRLGREWEIVTAELIR